VQHGLGGVLVDGADGRMRLVTTQVLSPPCPLQEGQGAEDCPCRASVAAAQVTWLKKKRRPDVCCHATLAIPLVTWDRVVGVICAALPPGRLLSEGEQRTLRTLGRQLGTAVENARLGVGMDMELRRLRALADASRHMIADLDTHTAMRGIVAAARQALEVDRAALYLYDAEIKKATVGHAEGISQPYIDFVVANFDRLLESISAEGQRGIVYLENVADDNDPFWREERQKEGLHSIAILPLYHRQRVLGVLSFYHDTVRIYSPEDRQFCRALADQAAMVVANALLYQEARRRLEELAALHEVDIQVSSALSLERVLAAVAEQLRRVLGVMTLYIGLYDAELDELDLQVIVDDGQFRPPLRVRFADAPSLAGWVARTGQPLWVDDFPNEAGRLPSGFMPVGDATRAIAVLPLTVKGKVVGVLSVQSYKPYAFDVGNRRLLREIATQAAIAIENARIYQQLEDQSTQLGSALHELQEVERMRSELVQNVSHELRTPLTLIEGYVDLLLSGDLGPIQAPQREALDVIYDRVMTLSRLIYNLTALQSIPRDELLLKAISVVDLIEHVLNGQRRSAERARVHFEPELPGDLPPVEGDWEHLGLAFSHLIDNAIKFSPDGGPVRIRAWREGQSVSVSIQDQGIGIAPECLDRIFERFYQADGSTTRRFGGMGVGLALVWEIVEAHRGTVIVKSQPDEGSTFIVSLPLLTEAG
jgi:signal transduction histidine kinase